MATAKISSAIVSRRQLATRAAMVERIIGLFLLMISLGGSVLWGGGGAEIWLKGSPFWAGAGASALLQIGLSAIQWTHAHERWGNRWWLAAMAASSTMTILGYWPLVIGPFIAVFEWAQVPAYTAPWLAGGLIVALGILIDYLPEQILTGESAKQATPEAKENGNG